MKDSYKIKSTNIPLFTLIVFAGIISIFIFLFFKIFGWSGLPGLIVLSTLWLLITISIFLMFPKRNDGLIIDDFGLHIIHIGQNLNISWPEIEKVGFQTIAAKRIGVLEVFPYLAISLKNAIALNNTKSSSEFGFLQKKTDFNAYMDQKDVSNLYISMKFAIEADSDLPNYLSTKTTFINQLKPLIKADNIQFYQEIINNNFTDTN